MTLGRPIMVTGRRPICVFPGCPNECVTSRAIWCAPHRNRMQQLADAGRRQREREGSKSAWAWTQIQRAGGDAAVADACTEILQRRDMPADGIIRLFTVLAPWRDETLEAA